MSTFEKSREMDIALLKLQQRYLETGRGKPTMRDLITEGIELILERENLPSLPKPIPVTNPVISIADKKTVA